LRERNRLGCLEYEEAYLPDSDARFVLQWILRARDVANPALNYCALKGGAFDASNKVWRLEMDDAVLDRRFTVNAKMVVNACGVWADRLNAQFGISTPYKHVFSKGVFIGIRRNDWHNTPIVTPGNYFTLIPWGPVSLWGPTETLIESDDEGFTAKPDDVRILLEEYKQHFVRPMRPGDIVSLRCGVRGLAVPQSARPARLSESLSRKCVIHPDRSLPWISIHGGKLTGAIDVAVRAAKAIAERLPTPAPITQTEEPVTTPGLDAFPGLADRVPCARMCVGEGCWTLDDYLRRRTNIAQWVARGGLGASNENAAYLERLAEVFPASRLHDSRTVMSNYQRQIEKKFDRVVLGAL
jgi:glycerol-3-phosphate dehydrogenase